MRRKHYVLALAPVSRGLGIFVMDTEGHPVEWRVREVRDSRHKNQRCLVIADKLIDQLNPVALVLEDHRASSARHKQRVEILLDLLGELGQERGIPITRFSMRGVRIALGLSERCNKDALAAEVAHRLPPLAKRLPKKRRLYTTEAHSMAIFTAAALALAHLIAP